jgi:phosphopantetheine adenylyltransferase
MVFFMSGSGTSCISSSAIHQMHEGGVDISALVPPVVVKAYEKKGH